MLLDPTVELNCVIEEDTITRGRKNIVARLDKLIKREGVRIPAIHIYKAPEELDKIEVVRREVEDYG